MQKSTEMDSNQFATIAVNLLHRGLLEADRTSAKRIFRELEEGRTVTLTKLKLDDGGIVRVDLVLKTDAFNGSLNYSAFRDGVLVLVARLSDELRAGKRLPIFQPIDPPDDLPEDVAETKLFGASGATVHDGTANVLMLGVKARSEQPVVTLQLVYVDPDQFASPPSSTS